MNRIALEKFNVHAHAAIRHPVRFEDARVFTISTNISNSIYYGAWAVPFLTRVRVVRNLPMSTGFEPGELLRRFPRTDVYKWYLAKPREDDPQ